MDKAVLLARLAGCIAALRAGNPAPCLDALLSLYDYVQDQKAATAAELDRALSIELETEEPFIWDEPCRQSE